MRGGRGRSDWIWVGCAVGLVIGCGGKNRETIGAPEAGTAGESTEVRGGAAGAPTAGSAGVSMGGASNLAGAAGAGGEPDDDAPGCLGLVGIGVGVEVWPDTYSFCRGQSGEVTIAHASGLSDMRFSCCAVSDTSPKYSLVIHGTLGADLEGSFGLTPPLSAPLGHQNLNVTCVAGGRLDRPIAIQLFGVPEVTSASSEIHPTDTVMLRVDPSRVRPSARSRARAWRRPMTAFLYRRTTARLPASSATSLLGSMISWFRMRGVRAASGL
jgi:hypothetical protein